MRAPLGSRPIALLALWASSLSAGCQTAIAPVEGEPGAKPVETAVRGLRRLGNREYNNVVRDLLGDESRPADRFGADVYPNGFDNGSAGLVVQSDQVADYQEAAEALAAAAVASAQGQRRLLPGCDLQAFDAVHCMGAFLDGFAARAFRRPLSEGERQRLSDLIVSAAADAVTPDGAPPWVAFLDGIQLATEVVLQSPQFLYREELGAVAAETDDEGAVEVQLTDDEAASELAFLFTGSLPDETLWTAVRQGRFHTAADRRREAVRLLDTPAARQTLRAFLHQWMGTDRLATLSKDQSVYPEWSPVLAASMSAELDAFYEAALFRGPGSLRQLLTWDHGFVDDQLAPIYGVAGGGGALHEVVLPADQRSGVLTRPGFLAAHATASDSGPIGRGSFLLDRVLCRAASPPPSRVPQLPDPDPKSRHRKSTRRRIADHTSPEFCQRCHKAINGAGFAFEAFDGIGRFRTSDGDDVVDSSGEITSTQEVDGPVSDTTELALRIAGSRRLAGCFAEQAWRFAMGRVESSSVSLDWLRDRSSPDGRMTDVLLAIVEDESFVRRRVERAEGTGGGRP